uniref:MAT1 centre domain-containing protein n=1 Tax=Hyaloperonospora arabidopsidis (strain Emoy2) TaxID=559515 RepID=M4BTY7_HYAAE
MTAADDADELALRCCVCGTSAEDDSNYLNTKMKMLISKCGHRLYVHLIVLSRSATEDEKASNPSICDHCIKREFQHKREVACAACQKPVKKSQLQDRTIEELNFAKETSVRKKVTKDYNKTEEDFDTLDEYNDYLEMLENLSTRRPTTMITLPPYRESLTNGVFSAVFDLVYGNEDERAAAQKQWKQYRQENAISIATNDAKKADEERRIAQLIAEQQRLAEERRQLQQREDSQFEADIERQKAQLMEVALGERDESDVSTLRATTTAIPIDQAVTAEMEAAMMGFQPGAMGGAQPVPVPGGKRGPNFGVNESKKLRRQQQLAGGYDPDLHFKRNRTEAWCGIYFYPTDRKSDTGNGQAQWKFASAFNEKVR